MDGDAAQDSWYRELVALLVEEPRLPMSGCAGAQTPSLSLKPEAPLPLYLLSWLHIGKLVFLVAFVAFNGDVGRGGADDGGDALSEGVEFVRAIQGGWQAEERAVAIFAMV